MGRGLIEEKWGYWVRGRGSRWRERKNIGSNDNIQIDAFAEYNNELSFMQLAPSERSKAYLYALDTNGNPYSPSWHTLNLRTKYSFSKALTLTATLENITDQRYQTYSSGIAASGRNLILALRYSL